MNNMEVWIMVLSREHEWRIKHLETESRTQRALRERPRHAERPVRYAWLRGAWRVVAELWRDRCRGTESRRGAFALCGSAGDG